MPDQTVFSTTDGHRLFSLQLGSGTTEDAAASGSSKLEIQNQRAHVRDGLMLDLRLETCVHGKLSNGKDFLSLIVFALQPVAQIGENIPSLSSMTITLGFDREIPQEHDIIEVLETGEDGSLTAEVHANKRGISWSTRSLNKRSRFGVLLRRSFDDLFFINFTLKLTDKSSRHFRSPALLERSDEAEPVLFDPSAKAIGDDIDLEDLQAASSRVLLSLSAPSQIVGAGRTNELPLSTMSPESSQNATGTQSETASFATSGNTSQSQDPAKIKSLMMYHHKQRHIHKPHHATKARAASSPGHTMETHPLQADDLEEEDVWTDPVRYITTHEMGFNMFGMHITRSGVRCIRSIKMKLVQTNDSGETEEYEATGHWSMFGMLIHKKAYHDEIKDGGQNRYLVVGRMSTNGFVIKEKIIRYTEHDEEQMLRRLHEAVSDVRGLRSFFSLKSVSGFSLYQCDPSAGHHTRPVLNESQRSCLRSFYNSYKWRSQGAPEFLWDDWVFKHLNNSSKNPSEGRYSIEILLSWSVLRLSFVTSIPVALSLAVGFWYQTLPVEDGSDPTGTAWIIATYIITAGALIIAFLGVATGLEQA